MKQCEPDPERGKVIVLGFDGVDFELAERWIRQKKLPNFHRLMTEGACGPLTSTPDAMSPSAWTSFATGKNPGKHGIYNFIDLEAGTLNLRHNDARNRDGETVWTLADRAGRRCAVLNVPMTFPVDPINGVMVAGWTAPGIRTPGFTHPPELIRELVLNFGEINLFPTVKKHISEGRPLKGIESLHADFEQKRAMCERFLNMEDWDLFISFFIHTDQVQHYYWHHMDPSHPEHDPDSPKVLKEAVLEVYSRCDSLIGTVLDRMDPDTTLIVMSDHGHGPNHGTVEFLPLWLKDMGFAVDLPVRSTLSHGLANLVKASVANGLRRVYDLLNRHLDVRMKSRLNSLLPGLRDKVETTWRFGTYDWSRTTAFFHYEPRINLKGREPYGCVEPGAEYEAVRDRLINQLTDIRDAKTGERVVERVFRKEEVYHGNHLDAAPDIIIRWKKDCVVSGLTSVRDDGRVVVTDRVHLKDHRTGHHSPYGIFFAKGRSITPGTRLARDEASIMDLAPTVLYLIGLPVPDDMDGSVLRACIDPDFLKAHPVRTREAGQIPTQQRGRLTSEEKSLLSDHLRALGYLK